MKASSELMPTFRGLAPPLDLKSMRRIRRSRCRDSKSATLGWSIRKVASGAAAALVVLVAAAHAQSPKIHERMALETTELNKDVKLTNKTCQSSLTATFDWSAVPSAEELAKYSPEGYCSAALEGIQRVCSDELGKDAVRKQIKKVTCGFATSRQIELKDGTLDYKINFNSVNDADYVFEYLQNQL